MEKLTLAEVATKLGCSYNTVVKYYKDILKMMNDDDYVKEGRRTFIINFDVFASLFNTNRGYVEITNSMEEALSPDAMVAPGPDFMKPSAYDWYADEMRRIEERRQEFLRKEKERKEREEVRNRELMKRTLK